MKQILIVIIGVLVGAYQPCRATQPSHVSQPIHDSFDSAEVSLLTCAAGQEIYSLFGHTALRYKDPSRNLDMVFNYGMFSFNTPHFVLRFALGKTDYMLGVTDFQRFVAEYHFTEREVWQQTLQLTSVEKKRLWGALVENYLPENRMYRYNFFYDNCATRPRDQIESCLNGTIHYNEKADSAATHLTWRDLLHQYTADHPWSRFGIDLCIGAAADRPISFREQMFIPFYLQKDFREAIITDISGEEYPLVKKETKIVSCPTPKSSTSFPLSPLAATSILFLLTAGSTWYGIRHQKTLWGLDAMLFLGAGLAGSILAFLVFFSEHPAVSPNWLLAVLHPLHLFCLPCVLIRIRKKKLSRYMIANLLVLTLFIALWPIIPQKIPIAVLPLALCLLLRSASNLFFQKQRRNQ